MTTKEKQCQKCDLPASHTVWPHARPHHWAQAYTHCATCGRDLTDKQGNPSPTPCSKHGEASSIEAEHDQ